MEWIERRMILVGLLVLVPFHSLVVHLVLGQLLPRALNQEVDVEVVQGKEEADYVHKGRKKSPSEI